MTYTPVEIRHIHLRRGLFGYRRTAVDAALEEIADSFEEVWRERADLADAIERLEDDLVRYRELETLLRTTLVSAERASQELKDQARRESELVLTEAHAEARAITREALAERERLVTETRRIRMQLATALEGIEPRTDEDPAEDDVEDGRRPEAA
jgi:cell division initiation protein